MLFATQLLPNYNNKTVVTFSLKSKKKLALSSPLAKVPSSVFPLESASHPYGMCHRGSVGSGGRGSSPNYIVQR